MMYKRITKPTQGYLNRMEWVFKEEGPPWNWRASEI